MKHSHTSINFNFFILKHSMHTKSHQTLCDPMDCVAHQAPLTMGFSSKNTGEGFHVLLQGASCISSIVGGFLLLSHKGSPKI